MKFKVFVFPSLLVLFFLKKNKLPTCQYYLSLYLVSHFKREIASETNKLMPFLETSLENIALWQLKQIGI